MSYSNFLEQAILDHLFGLATWTAPAALWVGLSTADPGDDATGLAEPVGNNYGRVQVDPGSTNWLRTASTVDNKGIISFLEASGSWGTITHVCLFDAETTGNLLTSFALSAPKAVASGDTPRFAIGALDNTLD